MTINKKVRACAHAASRHLNRLILPDDIKSIRRDAITLRRYYELECNGCTREKMNHETWEQYDYDRNNNQMPYIEKRIASLEKRIAANCTALNIPYYLQTDPRGCCLYLGTTSQSNYSTEGFPVDADY